MTVAQFWILAGMLYFTVIAQLFFCTAEEGSYKTWEVVGVLLIIIVTWPVWLAVTILGATKK